MDFSFGGGKFLFIVPIVSVRLCRFLSTALALEFSLCFDDECPLNKNYMYGRLLIDFRPQRAQQGLFVVMRSAPSNGFPLLSIQHGCCLISTSSTISINYSVWLYYMCHYGRSPASLSLSTNVPARGRVISSWTSDRQGVWLELIYLLDLVILMRIVFNHSLHNVMQTVLRCFNFSKG